MAGRISKKRQKVQPGRMPEGAYDWTGSCDSFLIRPRVSVFTRCFWDIIDDSLTIPPEMTALRSAAIGKNRTSNGRSRPLQSGHIFTFSQSFAALLSHIGASSRSALRF